VTITNRTDRRGFLRGSLAIAGGAVAAGPFAALTARAAGSDPYDGGVSPDNGGYGPLTEVTGSGDLLVPEGFTAVRFGTVGTPMSNPAASPTPGGHDGMAAFVTSDPAVVALVRNHEIGTGARFAPEGPAYDAAAGGGTTTMRFNVLTGQHLATYPSLVGTRTNCAGGPTPGGSWLTCEESSTNAGGIQHGYIFEVPSSATAPVTPTPLTAMGAFVHEATATDPTAGIVYETEDRDPKSGFYRFLPVNPTNLALGGELQMLAVRGQPNFDTGSGQEVGKPLAVEWVTIDDPNPASYATNPLAVFQQGAAKGGASFKRGEGCWYGDGSIFFISTNGGDAGLGQVWEYRPRGTAGGQLVLVYESTDGALLEAPDNITVSPSGALLLFEDGDDEQFVRGLDRRGRIFTFAKNIQGDDNEFAGGTFSPDGSTLFVNIQSPGATYAITGPWERGVL